MIRLRQRGRNSPRDGRMQSTQGRDLCSLPSPPWSSLLADRSGFLVGTNRGELCSQADESRSLQMAEPVKRALDSGIRGLWAGRSLASSSRLPSTGFSICSVLTSQALALVCGRKTDLSLATRLVRSGAGLELQANRFWKAGSHALCPGVWGHMHPLGGGREISVMAEISGGPDVALTPAQGGGGGRSPHNSPVSREKVSEQCWLVCYPCSKVGRTGFRQRVSVETSITL